MNYEFGHYDKNMQKNKTYKCLVNPEPQNIPEQMKSPEKLWALFKTIVVETEKGREIDRRPASALDGKEVGPTYGHNSRLVNFENCLDALPKIKDAYALALALREDQEIGAVDVDHCFEADGTLKAGFEALIRKCGSYAEISPSGKSVRIFFLKGPGVRNFCCKNAAKRLGLKELVISCKNKFATATGKILFEDQRELIRNDMFFEELIAEESGTPVIDAQLELVMANASTVAQRPNSINTTSAVNYLSSWACDYDSWVKMGFALKRQGPEAEMYSLFVDFSRFCPEKFDEVTCRKLWDSITENQNCRPLTIRTIYWEAQKLGWAPPVLVADPILTLPDGILSTNTGHAERIHIRYGHLFAYHHSENTWYCWDGNGKWVRDPHGVLIGRNYALPALKEICAEINAMPVSASLGDSQKNQAALALSKAQGHVGEIVSNLRYVKSVRTVEAADFDNDPAMLNAPNCVIDLRTGELLPHDPKFLMTQMVKYNFNPDAKNELWEECVRVWSDGQEDLALYLQTMAGCVATGYPVEQLFLLHGSTSNGKSSFLETILDVMGTYGVVIDQKLLQPNANNNAEAPSPALATLRGRRVAVVGDWNENARLSEVAVKRLASGDKITARPLNSSPIEFNPTHTIIIRTNSLPQVDMGDAAIVRRLVILPWTKSINEGQKDLNLRRRLLEKGGGSGILSWIVQGAVRYILEYQSRGIMPKIPDSAADLMSEHRDENDPHRQWIESECDIAPDLHETSENIEKNYRVYIQSLGFNPELFSVAKLRSFLRFRGHKTTKIRGTRCWQGLKLKPKVSEDVGIPTPDFDGLRETEVGF